MQALATSSDANVLATPHILATDNVPAEINVGENIPLQENFGGAPGLNLGALGALAGGTAQQPGGLNPLALAGLGGIGGFNTPRQDVGTKIKITPHMNESNQIRLEIEEEISERGATSGSLGAVSITKRTARTTIVVDDQQTVVIGGLMRDAVVRSKQKVPMLGDLPVLGFLFRHSTTQVRKTNLLLILTPHVIHDQTDLRRIFERKMQERQEFLDRYFVFSGQDWEPPRDYARSNGLVEDVRQSFFSIEEQIRLEEESRPRDRDEHPPSDPIELPGGVRGGGGAPAAPGQPRLPRGRAAAPAAPAPAAAPPAPAAPAPAPPPAAPPPAPPAKPRADLRVPGAHQPDRSQRQRGAARMIEQRALGEILVRHGVIAAELLEPLYAQQREKCAPLVDLVLQTQAITESDVARALAAECGLPFVDEIDFDSVNPQLATRLPIGYAKNHRLLVVDEREDSVEVVCADPLDTDALDDVRATFGKPVEARVASPDLVIDAINRVYERQETATSSKRMRRSKKRTRSTSSRATRTRRSFAG